MSKWRRFVLVCGGVRTSSGVVLLQLVTVHALLKLPPPAGVGVGAGGSQTQAEGSGEMKQVDKTEISREK